MRLARVLLPPPVAPTTATRLSGLGDEGNVLQHATPWHVGEADVTKLDASGEGSQVPRHRAVLPGWLRVEHAENFLAPAMELSASLNMLPSTVMGLKKARQKEELDDAAKRHGDVRLQGAPTAEHDEQREKGWPLSSRSGRKRPAGAGRNHIEARMVDHRVASALHLTPSRLKLCVTRMPLTLSAIVAVMRAVAVALVAV
ncbi:MAG: hypothetical protein R3F19_15020 [Verrucomicrobiales bacterium]